MILTNKNIKDAIETLKTGISTMPAAEAMLYLHLNTHFQYIVERELCEKASNLNGDRSIWDRRTKGWKLIKEKYEMYLENTD